ncbi:DNRLRE domain-containing protein [Paractinoplanes durhamensis]|uniref:DNRLRE domain-containing protein n=1 Tax=Paractinoplanes durhamensis TaxID=113563 RepID=UPI003625CD8D
MKTKSRRILRGATVLALVAASATGPAQPAQAMNYSSAPLSAWTFTDSATPTTASVKPAGNAPVGSTVDGAGTTHTRRAYFTFDLAAFRGQAIHKASLSMYETEVADCTTPAPIEIWRTGKVTDKSTWRKSPAELELVAQRTLGAGPYCPGAYVSVDVAGYVTAALARNEKTLSFGVRLAAAAEPDPKAGRSLHPMLLSMTTNTVPTVSAQRLRNPDRACGTLDRHPAAGGTTYFTATVTDPDPNAYVTTDFSLWPVDNPETKTRFGYGYGFTLVSTDLRAYPDGTVLAWSVQAKDDDDQGEWGKTCYLTIDNTAPAAAPAVIARKYVETQYPGAGGPGVAGTFLLDAQGDRDVVAFDYYENQSQISTTVAANHPGGRAKISVTPFRAGDDQLNARSVDRAGNRGPWKNYAFYVRDTAPRIDVLIGGVGLPSTINLYSRATDVTSFGFTVDGGPETTVPAVDSKATAQVVFATKGTKTIVSRSYAGKKMIGSDTQQIYVDDAPKLASAQFLFPAEPILGDQGTFTFTPRTTGVVAYLYDFGDGDQKRVDAAADGTATLAWTATKPGYFSLGVTSVTADGTRSTTAYDQFWVTDTRPAIWSDAGQCCPVRDGVGVPVRVSLSSDLPGVTGFVYSYDGGPEKTTTDGAAYTDVTVTPAHVGDSTFTARAIFADGTFSPSNTITISITNAPVVTNKGPYADYAVVGRESTLTFKPATPDVVSYRYQWIGDPDGSQTVDAAADGSAQVVWTAAYVSVPMLGVVAVSRDGTESDERRIYVEINDPGVEYEGSWNDWFPAGGVGVPGRLGFFGGWGGMADATVKYLWHVNDGAVQEVTRDENSSVTDVSYTPDRTGENTLYVQRQFTDGVLSPIRQYTLMVGAEVFVQSADYPAGSWKGGPGVAGTFHLSGGLPGVVSFDYRFTDGNGAEAAAGTAAADSSGAADVVFTPATGFSWHTLTVTGHTADGTATDETTYSFGVNQG